MQSERDNRDEATSPADHSDRQDQDSDIVQHILKCEQIETSIATSEKRDTATQAERHRFSGAKEPRHVARKFSDIEMKLCSRHEPRRVQRRQRERATRQNEMRRHEAVQ
jgi:hypothetical protein